MLIWLDFTLANRSSPGIKTNYKRRRRDTKSSTSRPQSCQTIGSQCLCWYSSNTMQLHSAAARISTICLWEFLKVCATTFTTAAIILCPRLDPYHPTRSNCRHYNHAERAAKFPPCKYGYTYLIVQQEQGHDDRICASSVILGAGKKMVSFEP
jgi:hypothetical protein